MINRVRRGAGPNGTDASVPINVAYNHHYGLTVVGAGASVERVKRDPSKPETMMGHDAPGEPGYVNIPVEHTPDPNGLPTSGLFGYNNGGEFRKSYHGLAPPFAQIIASPREVHFGPVSEALQNAIYLVFYLFMFPESHTMPVPFVSLIDANRHLEQGKDGYSRW